MGIQLPEVKSSLYEQLQASATSGVPPEDKLSYNEFAQKVKAKYPEFKNYDDIDVAKIVLRQYPSYLKVVNPPPGVYPPLEKAPGISPPPAQEEALSTPYAQMLPSGSSLYDTIKSKTKPVTEPIEDFYKKASNLIGGYAEKAKEAINEPAVGPAGAGTISFPKFAAETLANIPEEKTAIVKGMKASTPGVMLTQKIPEGLPPSASTSEQVSYKLGELLGDFPLYLVSYYLGGGPITGMGASFAIPSAIRKVLIDRIKKGEVKSVAEFFNRLKDTFKEAGINYATGLATGAAGKVAPTGTKFLSELLAMTETPRIIKGEPLAMPSLADMLTLGTVKAAGGIVESLIKSQANLLGKKLSPPKIEELNNILKKHIEENPNDTVGDLKQEINRYILRKGGEKPPKRALATKKGDIILEEGGRDLTPEEMKVLKNLEELPYRAMRVKGEPIIKNKQGVILNIPKALEAPKEIYGEGFIVREPKPKIIKRKPEEEKIQKVYRENILRGLTREKEPVIKNKQGIILNVPKALEAPKEIYGEEFIAREPKPKIIKRKPEEEKIQKVYRENILKGLAKEKEPVIKDTQGKILNAPKKIEAPETIYGKDFIAKPSPIESKLIRNIPKRYKVSEEGKTLKKETIPAEVTPEILKATKEAKKYEQAPFTAVTPKGKFLIGEGKEKPIVAKNLIKSFKKAVITIKSQGKKATKPLKEERGSFSLKKENIEKAKKEDVVDEFFKNISIIEERAERAGKPIEKYLSENVGVPKNTIKHMMNLYSVKEQYTEVKPILNEIGEALIAKEKGNYEQIKSKLSKKAQNIIDLFDVRAPFERIGGEETGRAIEAYQSRKSAARERAVHITQRLKKKLKLTNPQDQSDLFFVVSKSPKFKEINPKRYEELGEKAEPVRQYFNELGETLKKWGVLSDLWPQSAIKRNAFRIGELRKRLERLNKSSETLKQKLSRAKQENKPKYQEALNRNIKNKQRYQKELGELTEEIRILKQLKYAHIPTRVIFESLKNENPQLYKTILSGGFSRIKGRETADPYDLVEAGIPKEKFNIIDSIAHATEYVYSQRAHMLIREALLKDKLLKLPEDLTPDEKISWIKPSSRFPALRKYMAHPVAMDLIENHMKALEKERGTLSKILATVKMLQFYNPLILPLFDSLQGVMIGSLRTAKTPIYLKRAVFRILKRDAEYYEALDNNILSLPFPTPFKSFLKDVEKTRDINTLADLIKYNVKEVKNPVGRAYELSWYSAWFGDKLLRFTTYEYLRSKGFSPRDAAEIAAHAHGNYAGVPPSTRLILNKFFFTPTYQIAMAKFYAEMLAGTARLPETALKKLKGEKLTIKERKNIAYSKALISTVASNIGIDWLMRQNGWKREQYGRKYYKVIKVEGEPKEIVVVIAGPQNILQRYYFNFLARRKGMTYPEQVAKGLKYMSHPAIQLLAAIKNNQRPSGGQITNTSYPRHKQYIDVARFALGFTVKMALGLIDEPEPMKERAAKELFKTSGKIFDRIIKPITFMYLRTPKEKAIIFKLKKLQSDFTTGLSKNANPSLELFIEMAKNYNKQLDEYEKELGPDAKNLEAEEAIQRAREYIKNKEWQVRIAIKKIDKGDKRKISDIIEEIGEPRTLAKMPKPPQDIEKQLKRKLNVYGLQ